MAIEAVFDESILAGGLLSEVIELDNRRAAVFVVTAHTPATRQPLDDVRDLVAEGLKAEQAEVLMSARADDMLAAIAAGQTFAEAAAALGVAAAEPVVLTRNASDVDPLVAAAVFTAVKPAQDAPTMGSTRTEAGGFVVYSIDAVIPGRPEAIPLAERDAGKLQLADQSGIGDFVAFVQALRASADVAINKDALAAQDLLQ